MDPTGIAVFWTVATLTFELIALFVFVGIAWRLRPHQRFMGAVFASAIWVTVFYGRIVAAAALLPFEPAEVAVNDDKSWCEKVGVLAGTSYQPPSELFIAKAWPDRYPPRSAEANIVAYPDAWDCLPWIVSGAAAECAVGSKAQFARAPYDADALPSSTWTKTTVSTAPECIDGYKTQISPGKWEWPLFKGKLGEHPKDGRRRSADDISNQCFTYAAPGKLTGPTIALVKSYSQDNVLGIVRFRFEHRLIDLRNGDAVARSFSAVYLADSALNPWFQIPLKTGVTRSGSDLYQKYLEKSCAVN